MAKTKYNSVWSCIGNQGEWSRREASRTNAVRAPSGITDSDPCPFVAITSSNTVALVPDLHWTKMNVAEFPASILTNDDSILRIQSDNEFVAEDAGLTLVYPIPPLYSMRLSLISSKCDEIS